MIKILEIDKNIGVWILQKFWKILERAMGHKLIKTYKKNVGKNPKKDKMHNNTHIELVSIEENNTCLIKFVRFNNNM